MVPISDERPSSWNYSYSQEGAWFIPVFLTCFVFIQIYSIWHVLLLIPSTFVASLQLLIIHLRRKTLMLDTTAISSAITCPHLWLESWETNTCPLTPVKLVLLLWQQYSRWSVVKNKRNRGSQYKHLTLLHHLTKSWLIWYLPITLSCPMPQTLNSLVAKKPIHACLEDTTETTNRPLR